MHGSVKMSVQLQKMRIQLTTWKLKRIKQYINVMTNKTKRQTIHHIMESLKFSFAVNSRENNPIECNEEIPLRAAMKQSYQFCKTQSRNFKWQKNEEREL